MYIEIYNHTTHQIIGHAEIMFATDIFYIESAEHVSLDWLYAWMRKQLYYVQSQLTLEREDQIFEELRLNLHRHNFGRVAEELHVLYALLHHFRFSQSDEDDIGLYPLQDEVVSFVGYNWHCPNLYHITARKGKINDVTNIVQKIYSFNNAF